MRYCPFRGGECTGKNCAVYDGFSCGLCITKKLDLMDDYLAEMLSKLDKLEERQAQKQRRGVGAFFSKVIGQKQQSKASR